ncbi:MAG: serine/threonine protein kinase [candidate division Zixibacteria bacterium]|nr:serine/threonine protein kinase [candidate division Zixibacteria bacterium]
MLDKELADRIKELTGWTSGRQSRVVTDTSDWMRINRGDVLRLRGHDFVIKGTRYETRFGIGEQPKYWVFGAIDLENGREKIIKTVFYEDFNVRIGVFKIRCYRSPEKEGRVLELVGGDRRFMQGYTVNDEVGNNVRIIDYIRGETILEHIHSNNKSHEQYFYEDLPGILHKLTESIQAIYHLHFNHTCHGDIRNDHIIIESGTGLYRWIDFDLNQHVSDFDTWSIGNIINYAVAQGICSFSKVLKSNEFSEKVKLSLTPDDGGAFYEYRVMNLKKLYSYIPDSLNEILLHFTINPKVYYTSMTQLLKDYRAMLKADFILRSDDQT